MARITYILTQVVFAYSIVTPTKVTLVDGMTIALDVDKFETPGILRVYAGEFNLGSKYTSWNDLTYIGEVTYYW